MIYVDRNNIEKVIECMNNNIHFIIPLLSNTNKHYLLNEVNLLYCYNIDNHEEYVININNNDATKINIKILDNFQKRNFVLFKKYLNIDNQYDANMLFYFNTNKMLVKEHRIPIVQFYQRLYNTNEINLEYVPITKLVQYCRAVKNRFLIEYNKFQITEPFIQYNDVILSNLEYITQSGLYTVNGEYEYTDYLPFTTTGRPTNFFGKTNYAALNKDNNERSKFISRFKENGFLMEFDFKSFHLNLICKLIGYEFKEDIYIELGKIYFNTDKLTPEQIKESKTITFRQIYGGIENQYKTHDFFYKLDIFINNINVDNSFSYWYNKPMLFPNDVTQIKAFNYLLQNFETEINMELITNIRAVLNNFNSKLILYTYDSFLFDYNTSDGVNLINKLKEIFNSVGEFRFKIGNDYSNMIYKNI